MAPNRPALTALGAAGPFIMGILNTTPDSFSDGGRWSSVDAAVAQADRMLLDGAQVIDVGGESSRPGASSVSLDGELERVLPVIERLADRCIISIDTAKPEVAHRAVLAGASIVNDITARLEDVAAEHGAGWIAMHMQGEPRTMQDAPVYDDVIGEVGSELRDAVGRGRRAGVGQIWVDPGIGFGKSTEHNLLLLRHLGDLTPDGARMAVGVSRKRLIGSLHAAADGVEQVSTDDRVEGSVQAAVWSMRAGASMIRAHDVRSTALAAGLLAGHDHPESLQILPSGPESHQNRS